MWALPLSVNWLLERLTDAESTPRTKMSANRTATTAAFIFPTAFLFLFSELLTLWRLNANLSTVICNVILKIFVFEPNRFRASSRTCFVPFISNVNCAIDMSRGWSVYRHVSAVTSLPLCERTKRHVARVIRTGLFLVRVKLKKFKPESFGLRLSRIVTPTNTQIRLFLLAFYHLFRSSILFTQLRRKWPWKYVVNSSYNC